MPFVCVSSAARKVITLFALWVASGSSIVLAASPTVSVNLSGAVFGVGRDVHVSSGDQRIVASRSYTFRIEGSVRGTGLLAALLPSGTSISSLVERIEDGTGTTLSGIRENPNGALPFELVNETFSGDISVPLPPPIGSVDVSASMTIRGRIAGTGQVRFDVTNVDFDVGLPVGNLGTIVFEPGSRLLVSVSPVIQFASETASVREDRDSVLLIVRRAFDASRQVKVQYATTAGSASISDFRPATGELVFPAGVREKRLRVRVNDNDTTDGSRTFQVDLSAPTNGAILGRKQSVLVTIRDDD